MATLYEYYVKGARTLTTQVMAQLSTDDGRILGEITQRLHIDLQANAKYVSFYIPGMDGVECPEAFALRELPQILKWPETNVGITSRYGDEEIDGRELIF